MLLAAVTTAAAIGIVTAIVVPDAAPAMPAGTAPEAVAVASAAPAPSAAPVVKKPKAASKTRKARNVPERPRDRHHGKRIVYDKALMTVWLMDADDNVVARYPVVGRWDRPKAGTYHVMSKSPMSYNPESKVTFEAPGAGGLTFLDGLPFVRGVTRFGDRTTVQVHGDGDIQHLLQALVAHGVPLRKFDANDIRVRNQGYDLESVEWVFGKDWLQMHWLPQWSGLNICSLHSQAQIFP